MGNANGVAIASSVFLEKPFQTSAAPEYMRQRAVSVASKMSVSNPARLKARGKISPSWRDERIALWPPTVSYATLCAAMS